MEQRYIIDFEAYNKIYTIEKSTFNKEFQFDGHYRVFKPLEEYKIKYIDHQYQPKKTGGYMIKHNPNVDKNLLSIAKLPTGTIVENKKPQNDSNIGSIFNGPQSMPKVPTAINGKSTIQQNAESTLSKRSLLPSNGVNSAASIPNIFAQNLRAEESKRSNSFISKIKRSVVNSENKLDKAMLIERLSSISLNRPTLISNPSHILAVNHYSVSHVYEGKKSDNQFNTQLSKQKHYNEMSNMVFKRAQTTKPKSSFNDRNYNRNRSK